MIVKNEAAVLERCLRGAEQIADEIIIVDTGSSDDTMKIARRFTDLVYEFEWIDDFAAARNFSFSKATCGYILWLDADDVIDDENITKLLALKSSLADEVDVAMLKYNVTFDAQGKPLFSYYRERLLRRSNASLWQEPVHEYITPWGMVRQYDIAVTHLPGDRHTLSTRNLDIYERRIAEGGLLSARATYYYARELRTHGRYADAIMQYRFFLGMPGVWLEDAIWASADLADCLVLEGNDDDALDALFRSFSRDLPRAEILCRVAEIYLRRGDDEKAIFWYEFALAVPRPNGWGFLSEEHWGYIPHMQLCMLHDRAGRRSAALRHHEAAKALQPTNASVLFNERYFFGGD